MLKRNVTMETPKTIGTHDAKVQAVMKIIGDDLTYQAKVCTALEEAVTEEEISSKPEETAKVTKEKLCAICGAKAKYCCPACSTRTCSLNCVKAHKIERECNGIRDKTTFVPVNNFTNVNLLSDYRFLEETSRAVNNAERARKKQPNFSLFLPSKLFKLKRAARFRKTQLKILPMVFSRRQLNSTYLNESDNVIFWKIEWFFPQIGESFFDEEVHEKTSINMCLQKYLSPEHSDIEVKEKLCYFQSVGYKEVCVLLKKEHSPANDTRFFMINKNKSLQDNLKNKVITEHPTFIVIGRNHVHTFNLVGNE